MSSASNPEHDDMPIGDDSGMLFEVLKSGHLERCDGNSTILDSKTAVQDGETETSLQSPNQTDFPLLKLPPELRLLIYKPLIAAGDLNIMRTSKLIHMEAADLLKKYGILRMNLGYTDRKSSAAFPLTWSLSPTGIVTAHATETIQNVEYHFNVASNVFLVWSSPLDTYTNLVKLFGGRDIMRQSCRIVLHIGRHGWAPDRSCFVREPTLQALTKLTGFKTLIFRITNEWDHHTHHRVERFGIMAIPTEKDYTHITLLEDYQSVRRVLEITLGPAILDLSLKGHCLEFHPSEFKTEAETKTERGSVTAM